MSHQHPRAWSGSVCRMLGTAITIALSFAATANAQNNNPYFVSNANQGEMVLSVALSDGDLLTFRAAGPGGTGMFGIQPSSPPIAGGTVLTIRGLDFASPELSPPSMNSSGALVFTDLDTDGSSAMFSRAGSGNILTIRGDNGAFARAGMGFHGTIYGDFRNAAGQASLLAYPPGGNHITIVGQDFGARSFGRTRSSSSSPSRTYTLFDAFPQNGVINSGILSISSGGEILTIIGREQFNNVRGPGLSGETVVFSGNENASGLAGVFARTPGGSIITIAGGNFLGAIEFSEPAANEAGAVVFARLGAANGGVDRIYFSDLFGSPAQTLIELGDELLGSTVTGLTFNADGLNQASDFGYGVQLADGRSAVMIASNIPAPGSLVLLGIGAAVSLRRRR